MPFVFAQYPPAGRPGRRLTRFFPAILILVLSAAGSAAAPEPLYHWRLTDGSNAGTASMSNLTIESGTEGIVAFTEDGLDSTQTIPGNTAKSGIATGSLGAAADLSKFTITFWVKTPVAQSGYQNILAILPANESEREAEDRLLIRFKSNKGDNSNKLEVMVGGPDSSGIVTIQEEMIPSPNGEWRFFAISYDGTSPRVDNSDAQAAATGSENRGTSNLQIYQASENPGDALARQGFNWGKGGDRWVINHGPVMLGDHATILLGNQADLTRGLVGLLKDVHVYNDVLTAAEIENIRTNPGKP